MMAYEAEIEKHVCDYALHTLGIINVKVKAAGQRGYPDRMFFIPGGKPVFIEFKRPGGVLSKGQEVIIRRLRYYGYKVEVCDTFEKAVEFLKSQANRPRSNRDILKKAN